MTDIFTLAWKEIKNFFKIWKQTIVPSVMTAVLYILIFGKFLWDQISSIEWISYIHYIFPWLLMMSVIMWAYAITAFGFFTAKMFKNLEELLVAPITKNRIILGYMLAGITRWVVVWVSVFVVASFFIPDVTVKYPFLSLLFTILTSATFSLAWLLNWIFARNFDDVNLIPNFIITPMIYLWGVFYSVSMLWDFWQILSQFNPILYMVNGLRFAFLWVSDVSPYTSLIILVVFIIWLYLLALYLLKKGYRIRS